MKNATLLSLLVLLAVSCSKPGNNNGGGGNPPPRIDTYTPSSVTTGATVTLTGVNFGSSINNVIVMLGTIAIIPTSVTSNSIEFNVPTNLLASGSQVFTIQVIINNIASNTIQVTVTYILHEPHGWFYINKDVSSNPGLAREIYFYDDPHHFGFAFGKDIMAATSDDGATWGGIWPHSHLGTAFYVYDEDEAWIETGVYDIMVYDYDYSNAHAHYARLDSITTIPALKEKGITGAYITRHNHGYLLTHDGSIIKINGSFSPSDISVEYQPSVYTSLPLAYGTNNFYAMAGIDSNNMMIAGRPMVNGAVVPMVIVKRNGIYKEYSFSYAEVGYPYRLQFADIDNIFMLSINYELYKLNIATNTWQKLNTPKFNEICFINGSTGYASTASGEECYIYKTTDGGITWKMDFVLDRFHSVITMCKKNNKVWALGESIYSHANFMVKYNP
jgi:hypothetical protein